MTPQDRIAYYRRQSRHFLNLVDDELARGELEEASNKLWGAAAHAIKAVAESRDWTHNSHALLESAIMRSVAEGAPAHLVGLYDLASRFHRGFYGDQPFTANQIRNGKQPIAEFIQTLESLPPPNPAP